MKKIYLFLLIGLIVLAGCSSQRISPKEGQKTQEGLDYPTRCTIAAPISCEDPEVNEEGVSLVINNANNFDLQNVVVKITNCGNSNPIDFILAYKQKSVNIKCSLTPNEKFYGDISVEYSQGSKIGFISTLVKPLNDNQQEDKVKNYATMPKQAGPDKDGVCNPPYIKFKNSCFIDGDGDGVWDYLPGSCGLEKGIGCTDHIITKDGIAVFLHNQMGFDIEKITVDIVGCGSTSAGLTHKEYLANNQQDLYAISCPLTGPTFAGDLSVTYTNVDTKSTHTLLGALAGNVESKSINEYTQKYLDRN